MNRLCEFHGRRQVRVGELNLRLRTLPAFRLRRGLLLFGRWRANVILYHFQALLAQN
jgi:hypothetical protein